MIPSTSTQVDPCSVRILKKRTRFKIPSITNSAASASVSDAIPSRGCKEVISAETEIGNSDKQLPHDTAGAVGVKSEHQMDYAGQNDQPCDDYIHRHRGKHRRTDRQHAEDNQQNAPQN